MQFRSGVVYAVRLSKRYTTSEGQPYNSGIWRTGHQTVHLPIENCVSVGVQCTRQIAYYKTDNQHYELLRLPAFSRAHDGF